MKHHKCQFVDCQHGAKFIPAICVPATGWAIDVHRPIKVMIDLKLCESCFSKLDVKDWLDDTMCGIVNRATMGRQPPDFERAFFQRVLVSSKEARDFFRNADDAKLNHAARGTVQ